MDGRPSPDFELATGGAGRPDLCCDRSSLLRHEEWELDVEEVPTGVPLAD